MTPEICSDPPTVPTCCWIITQRVDPVAEFQKESVSDECYCDGSGGLAVRAEVHQVILVVLSAARGVNEC